MATKDEITPFNIDFGGFPTQGDLFDFKSTPTSYDFAPNDFNFGSNPSEINSFAGADITRRRVLPTTPPPTTSGFMDFFASPAARNLATGVGAVGSLAQALAGFKQADIAKKTLSQNRAAFNRNLANQATLINAQLQDREARRVAENQQFRDNPAAAQEEIKRRLAGRTVSGAPI